MNPRTTGVLAIVTALLGAFVYFYEIGGEEGRKDAEEATKQIFGDVAADGITRIELVAGDGTEAVVERSDAGWHLRAPVSFPADQATLDGLASTLAELTSESVIEEPQPATVYGLDAGAEVVRFESGGASGGTSSGTSGGTSGGARVLRIGSKTPVGSNSYASTDGDERVFIVPTWRVNSLKKEVDDLRDRRVLPFDRATISRVQASWRGGEVSLEKRDEGWWVVAPVEGRADDDTLDDLLSDLAFMRADGFEDEPLSDSESGLDRPEFSAVLSGQDDAGAALEFRFAMGSMVEGGARLARGIQDSLYRVAGERLSELPRSVVAYRFKRVSSFEASDARRFELDFPRDSDGYRVVGTYGESGWTTEPEALADGKAGVLISQLAHLKGVDILAEDIDEAGLAQFGLAPEAVRIRVWDGGDSEAPPVLDLSLGASDDSRIIVARPAGGAQVYQLDADLAEQIPVSLEAFRNRFVGQDEPEAAEGEPLPEMSLDPS